MGSRSSDLGLRARVIHSLPLRMSAIRVTQAARPVAVAHLIGLDQLPKLDEHSESRVSTLSVSVRTCVELGQSGVGANIIHKKFTLPEIVNFGGKLDIDRSGVSTKRTKSRWTRGADSAPCSSRTTTETGACCSDPGSTAAPHIQKVRPSPAQWL